MTQRRPIITESTIELLAHIYSFMSAKDKAEWSMAKARDLVDDQYRYEIAEGFTPPYYSVRDFFEIIAEFIADDALVRS